MYVCEGVTIPTLPLMFLALRPLQETLQVCVLLYVCVCAHVVLCTESAGVVSHSLFVDFSRCLQRSVFICAVVLRVESTFVTSFLS